jgi:hypothetical protein
VAVHAKKQSDSEEGRWEVSRVCQRLTVQLARKRRDPVFEMPLSPREARLLARRLFQEADAADTERGAA